MCLLISCSSLTKQRNHVLSTGLFCVRVLCMLSHLRVLKIPEVYIMKRYTRNARSNATFDRRDYEQTAPDGTSLFCHRKLRQKQQWTLQTERQGPTLGAIERCLV